MMDGPRVRRAWRFVLLLVAMAVAAVLVATLGPPDLRGVRQDMAAAGIIAPVAAAVGIAAGILLMVPRTAMSIAAGILFGWMPAFVVVVAGALMGASGGFGLGRLLGRDFVSYTLARWSRSDPTGASGWRVRLLRRVERGLARADAWLGGHGIVGIWIARLIPVSHFGFLSYASGTSSVRYRDFMLGTFIGCLPGSLGYTAVGGAVLGPGGVKLALALAVGLNLLSLTTWAVINRRLSKRATTAA